MQNEKWVDISKRPIFFKNFGHFIVASRVISYLCNWNHCGYEDDTDEGNTKHHRPKRTEQALYGE